jgi:hypothetical protein
MTVGITEGNYCIVYKESKPNDMGSSIKDNMHATIYRLVAMYMPHPAYYKIYLPTTR